MKRILAALLVTVLLLLSGCNARTPGGSGDVSGSPSGSASAGTDESGSLPGEDGSNNDASAPSGGTPGTPGTSQGTSSTPAGSNVSTGGRPGTGGASTSSAKPSGPVGAFMISKPGNGAILQNTKPAFSWLEAGGAQSYTLVLEEMQADGSFKKVGEKSQIKTTSYTWPTNLKANTYYRWSVYGISGSYREKAQTVDEKDAIFMAYHDYKTHPANKGLDFTFKNKISEKVLKNYLSRSMIANLMFHTDLSRIEEDIRMVMNTGAKYIGRAGGTWAPNAGDYLAYPEHEKWIKKIHSLDPEMVLEACIFETVYQSVEGIAIPEYVFKAFNQKVENRNFSYRKMLYPEGLYENHWGSGASVPDIRQTETKMFFYYRATKFIDMGYEGLHMGQVHLIGARDSGWKNWTELLDKIRAYAKTHARRNFVLINAHTHGIKDANGKLMFDFHCYPMRGVSKPGAQPHTPTEDNPQEIVFQVGYHDSIYKRSMGGTTYSGWSTSSLPYFVELDNWNGYNPAMLDKPTSSADPIAWWGFDEISWFANQPARYRASWLEYAYDWVNKTDPAGFAQMPGSRTAAIRNRQSPSLITQLMYYNNSTLFDRHGFNDEFVIRNIWIKDLEKRK